MARGDFIYDGGRYPTAHLGLLPRDEDSARQLASQPSQSSQPSSSPGQRTEANDLSLMFGLEDVGTPQGPACICF